MAWFVRSGVSSTVAAFKEEKDIEDTVGEVYLELK
jgi:hypothetical protein